MTTVLGILKRIVQPPVFADDEQKTQEAQALYVVFGLFLMPLVIAFFGALLIGQQRIASYAFILSGIIVCLISYREIRQGRIRRAEIIFISSYWIVSAVFVLVSGGLTTASGSLFLGAMVVAALFLGIRASVIVFGLTLAFTLIIVAIDETGYHFPEVFVLSGIRNWLVLVYSVLIASAPVLSMQRSQRRALDFANKQLKERTRVENSLRESQERYRLISEMIWDYAFAYDVHLDGSLKLRWMTDDSFYRVTGYRFGQLGGTFALYHPDDRERVKRDVAETIRGNVINGEYRILTRDGRERWLSLQRQVIWDEAHTRVIMLYGGAQDITDRRQAEESSHRSQELLRALLDATTDVAFLTATDGTFLIGNKTIAEDLNLSQDDLTGFNAFELLSPNVSSERRIHFEEAARLKHAVRFEDTNGTDWWDNSVYPVLSSEREVNAYAIYSRKITDQKQSEQVRLELAIERERRQTFASLMAGVAHDLKTPLSVITTSLYLIEKHPDQDMRQQKLEVIKQQTQRLRDFIDDLLALSRLDTNIELRLAPVGVKMMLEGVAHELHPMIEEKRLRFSLLFDGDPPPLQADEFLLRRAFVNVIQNAITYTPEEGTVTVIGAVSDTGISIEIRDSGIGISADDLPHIFDPFFRGAQARAVSRSGSGLGLAVVQYILEQHHGSIVAESAPETGSTFRITLPFPA